MKEGKLDAEELRARCARGWLAGAAPAGGDALPQPRCLIQPASLLRRASPASRPSRRRKGVVGALLDRKNAGVVARDQKDRLELKVSGEASVAPRGGHAVVCGPATPPPMPACTPCARRLRPQTTTDRLSESRAALEKKAALYDRLAAGQADDEGALRCWREGRDGGRGAAAGCTASDQTLPRYLLSLDAHIHTQHTTTSTHRPAGDRYEVDFVMKPRQRQGAVDTTGLAVASGTGARRPAGRCRRLQWRLCATPAQAQGAAARLPAPAPAPVQHLQAG